MGQTINLVDADPLLRRLQFRNVAMQRRVNQVKPFNKDSAFMEWNFAEKTSRNRVSGVILTTALL